MEIFFLTLGIMTGWYLIYIFFTFWFNLEKSLSEDTTLCILTNVAVCIVYGAVLSNYFKPAFKLVINI